MPIESRGGRRYGQTQADIREELAEYSVANGYAIEHSADARCACGHHAFRLLVDDEEGVAIRICADCSHEHPMGDSADYLEDAQPEECECACGSRIFEVTVGVSLYADSEDVRWLYVGCRCLACGLTACYGDWKNEHAGYADLLARI